MKNKISQKIVAGLIVAMFTMSNSLVYALAATQKPVLRNEENNTIRLNADVTITNIDEKISLSLRDSDVKQVLRMFADKAGLNIIFDNNVSGNVTLDLVDVPLNTAFDMVMSISGLNYSIDSGTMIVFSSSSNMLAGKQEITIVPVKYIDASAMADFLNKNIFKMKKPGLSTADIVTVNPMTNELLIFGNNNDVAVAKQMIDKFDKKPISTSLKVNHTTPEQMAGLICKMLIPATSKGSGAANISGVMTGAASEVELGGGEIACTVGPSASSVYSSMPFQSLIISYFTQQGTVGIMGGSKSQQEMIKEFLEENDRKQPQAYLEVSILELSESGSKTLENNWQYISNNFSFNASNGTNSIGSVYPIFIHGDSYTHHTSANPNNDDPYEVTKYLGKSALTYTMNYIIENKKGRVVANPRILITNGQESTINLTSDYVKTVTTQFMGDSLTATSQRTYDIADDNGIKVSITPFISPDGYVTLNINPDYATIKDREYQPQAVGEPTLAATLLQRRNLELKNVRIKDGETLIIGGMIKEEETKSVKKIPVLGDLPGIGVIFRTTGTMKTKEEMIIMITPRILVDSDDVKDQATL